MDLTLLAEITKEAWNTYRQKQIEEVQSVIIQEIKEKGHSLQLADDAALNLIDMFITAKQLGAAQVNLRLMARVLKNFVIFDKV